MSSTESGKKSILGQTMSLRGAHESERCLGKGGSNSRSQSCSRKRNRAQEKQADPGPMVSEGHTKGGILHQPRGKPQERGGGRDLAPLGDKVRIHVWPSHSKDSGNRNRREEASKAAPAVVKATHACHLEQGELGSSALPCTCGLCTLALALPPSLRSFSVKCK